MVYNGVEETGGKGYYKKYYNGKYRKYGRGYYRSYYRRAGTEKSAVSKKADSTAEE